jgi:dTDP-4-dehydrorhamnose reductase
MARVLVTGAGGQLGAAFCTALAPTTDVVARDRAGLDVTDREAVRRAIGEAAPDVIVNCAAYNAVDAAEDDVPGAFAGNAFAVRNLALEATAAGATLVHFSSDFVFDGEGSAPYTEDDPPNPRSVYAQSKLVGEWFAADCPRHYVLRVESLFGGPQRKSSADFLLDRLEAGTPPTVFVDRTVSPSYVYDVVAATQALVARRAPFGLYHCVNDGSATWLDISVALKAMTGLTTPLVEMRFADATLKAARPRYCALSNAKLAAAGVTMPDWPDALRRHLQAIGKIG